MPFREICNAGLKGAIETKIIIIIVWHRIAEGPQND